MFDWRMNSLTPPRGQKKLVRLATGHPVPHVLLQDIRPNAAGKVARHSECHDRQPLTYASLVGGYDVGLWFFYYSSNMGRLFRNVAGGADYRAAVFPYPGSVGYGRHPD